MQSLPLSEWRYEDRRLMQEIIPNVFLGPYHITKDLNYLQSKGITHILSLRAEAEYYLMKPHFPQLFTYHFM